MCSDLTIREKVKRDGYATCDDVLSPTQVNELLLGLENIQESESVRKRGGVFAVRNLLDVSPEVFALARSSALQELVEPVLGPEYFPVRGILFDKIPNANWKVPWHQDVTIAVQEKIDVEGFGPWSVKSDVIHVQAPPCVLEQMFSVRLHLDMCGEANGALRVIAGSHRQGRIPEEQISEIRHSLPEHICTVALGGALLMRPLLLHASSPSLVPAHRRVVHLDFAAVQLPGGLQWFRDRQPINRESRLLQ